MPILVLVHSQMSNISWYSVRRWSRVSSRPYNRRRSVSLRFILARRTFVGTISCMALYSTIPLVSPPTSRLLAGFSTPLSTVCSGTRSRSSFPSFHSMPAPSCVVSDTCVFGVVPSSRAVSQVGYRACQWPTLGGIPVSVGLSFSAVGFSVLRWRMPVWLIVWIMKSYTESMKRRTSYTQQDKQCTHNRKTEAHSRNYFCVEKQYVLQNLSLCLLS